MMDCSLPLVLTVAASGCSYPAGILIVIAIGWWMEGAMMAPLGSAVGPLLAAFAALRWGGEAFVTRGAPMRLLWFIVGSAIAHLTSALLAGWPPRAWPALIPVIFGHGCLGLAGAGVIAWGIRRLGRPRQRRKIALNVR